MTASHHVSITQVRLENGNVQLTEKYQHPFRTLTLLIFRSCRRRSKSSTLPITMESLLTAR